MKLYLNVTLIAVLLINITSSVNLFSQNFGFPECIGSSIYKGKPMAIYQEIYSLPLDSEEYEIDPDSLICSSETYFNDQSQMIKHSTNFAQYDRQDISFYYYTDNRLTSEKYEDYSTDTFMVRSFQYSANVQITSEIRPYYVKETRSYFDNNCKLEKVEVVNVWNSEQISIEQILEYRYLLDGIELKITSDDSCQKVRSIYKEFDNMENWIVTISSTTREDEITSRQLIVRNIEYFIE